MTYLSADNIAQEQYRFFVKLASNEVEVDPWDEPVPANFKAIDVVVTQPTQEAIATLIASYDWLKEYSIVHYWQESEDEYCPF